MAFINSILAGVTLVRESIRSPNYVAGVSGWAIKQDGSAEFNNVVIRGSIAAGSIHIGTDPNSFNVDTNGNLWMGAATFAAANFSIDNTGLVTFKSTSTNPRLQFTDGGTAPFQWPQVYMFATGANGSRNLFLTTGKASALSRSAALTLRSADASPLISYAQLDAQQIDLLASPSANSISITSTNTTLAGPFQINGNVTTSGSLTSGAQITATTGIILGSSQFQSGYNTAGSASWTNANFLCNAGAGTTAIAFHPGGVAPQFRCGNSVDIIYVRNSADSAYSTLQGILVNTSSARDKQDIAPWPPVDAPGAAMGLMVAPRVSALERALALKPSTYRWNRAKRLTTVRPRKLTAAERRRAAKVSEPERRELEHELVEHECGIDCAGSAKEPCWRVRDWERPTLGLIAEQVFEVAPELCHVGPDGVADGLDAIALGALVLAAVQELAGDVAALKSELGRPT